MNLQAIQDYLQAEKLDGWLFFDHHQRDELAYRILGLHPQGLVSRRWYYFIPAKGEPRGLVHKIELGRLENLPCEKRRYASWQELAEGIRWILGGAKRVAMQYSPNCAIPYVSLVDAGTIETIRAEGVEVVSSANLVQEFESKWTQKGLDLHQQAQRAVDAARCDAFALVAERLRTGTRITEYDVKMFMQERYKKAGLVTDGGPIVAVNENCSDQHYDPQAGESREIKKGDFFLMDMWAKVDDPDAMYYDITWTGYCGEQAPEKIHKIFNTVKEARDRAVKFIKDGIAAKKDLRGYMVDDVARGYIREQGFAEWFVHRTGHSIGHEVHGTGANMDNLETHDERKLIPWTCFSIEPGIYLPEVGVRTEVDVFIGEDGARVTGAIQEGMIYIV
jgi:Xaa-Pro dipeptidase